MYHWVTPSDDTPPRLGRHALVQSRLVVVLAIGFWKCGELVAIRFPPVDIAGTKHILWELLSECSALVDTHDSNGLVVYERLDLLLPGLLKNYSMFFVQGLEIHLARRHLRLGDVDASVCTTVTAHRILRSKSIVGER